MARIEDSTTSVVQGLRQAHTALLEDLRQMEAAVLPSSGEGLVELCSRLNATRAHLAEHFRLEEHNGYMDAVRKREPRLERRVQLLAEEHHQLAQSLETLLGEARTATTRGDALPDQVRAWVEQVRQHEVRENQLVQEAFNLDINAED
jgi:hypothetical protein